MKPVIILAAALLLASVAVSQSIPSICPIKGFKGKTSEFGKRVDPILKSERDHNAVDFLTPEGTPVLATADGTVVQAETIEGYGVVVRLQHKSNFQTFYAHLSKVTVKAGQGVKRGQVIAYSGNSGTSTGPHLHYEVIQNGVNVNPREFMSTK